MKQSHKERWAEFPEVADLEKQIKTMADIVRFRARWQAITQGELASARKELRRRKAIGKSTSAEPVRSEASADHEATAPES